MIKAYFDWNVIAQMRNGQHPELKEIAFNDKRLMIPYSMPHINDIFSSYDKNIGITENIDSDLHYLSNLTRNHYLFNNRTTINLRYCVPTELFQNRISDKFTIENCFEMVDTVCSKLGIPNLFDTLKGYRFDLGSDFENVEGVKLLDIFIPGLKNNQTIGGLIDGFCKFFNSFSNGDVYIYLRQTMQSMIGINRDKIFNADNPYLHFEPFYKKFNTDISEHLKENVNYKIAPEWFCDIVNEHLILDMHGYQEDKINIQKGRKETVRNMIDDARHAAFASMCNFYVTNDKKAYNKAKMVYQKMQKNTKVFKPDEFVSYYNEFLKSL